LKVSEVRAMSSEELTKQLQTANRDLFDLRLKSSTKQLVNHREIPGQEERLQSYKRLSGKENWQGSNTCQSRKTVSNWQRKGYSL